MVTSASDRVPFPCAQRRPTPQVGSNADCAPMLGARRARSKRRRALQGRCPRVTNASPEFTREPAGDKREPPGVRREPAGVNASLRVTNRARGDKPEPAGDKRIDPYSLLIVATNPAADHSLQNESDCSSSINQPVASCGAGHDGSPAPRPKGPRRALSTIRDGVKKRLTIVNQPRSKLLSGPRRWRVTAMACAIAQVDAGAAPRGARPDQLEAVSIRPRRCAVGPQAVALGPMAASWRPARRDARGRAGLTPQVG
jgi:hypothetical protein